MKEYRDIVIFVVTLFAANAIWKGLIQGDELGYGDVTFCGQIVTSFFSAISQHTAECVYDFIRLFRDTIRLEDNLTLRFTNGHATRIVWSCTPVKQDFIWMCLILTTLPLWGKGVGKVWLHKLWYIPLGWIVIYGINILRIAAITLFIEQHPEWFEMLHAYLFKYLFYGILFLGWLAFTTWFSQREPRL